jgi:hypothetical protein
MRVSGDRSINPVQRLGLVAETLFVAVLLHALFALVLVDLGLTAFLDGAHGSCGRG